MKVSKAIDIGNNAIPASIIGGTVINSNAALAAALAANLIAAIIPPGIGPPKKPLTIAPNAPDNASSSFLPFHPAFLNILNDMVIGSNAAAATNIAADPISINGEANPNNPNSIPSIPTVAPNIPTSSHLTPALVQTNIATDNTRMAPEATIIATEPIVIVPGIPVNKPASYIPRRPITTANPATVAPNIAISIQPIPAAFHIIIETANNIIGTAATVIAMAPFIISFWNLPAIHIANAVPTTIVNTIPIPSQVNTD